MILRKHTEETNQRIIIFKIKKPDRFSEEPAWSFNPKPKFSSALIKLNDPNRYDHHATRDARASYRRNHGRNAISVREFQRNNPY